jgi:drug/metabolite transporter (DMT)-like permease
MRRPIGKPREPVYRFRSPGDRPSMRQERSGRLLGVVLVLLSAFAWSLNGLYTRLLTVDLVTTLVGRGIATATLLFLALAWTQRRNVPRILAYNTRRGWLVSVSGALCMMTFVGALFHTSVAAVTVIYALSPLIAAVLARILIGDRLVPRTLLAFVVAVLGTAIMVGGSLGTGRLLGNLLAVVMAATFAIVIVEMRRKPDIDNVASSFLTSALTVAVLVPFAHLGTIDLWNAAILFLFGFTSNVLGFFLFVAAIRRMPPAEAGLLATVEIVLAPFWVWLFFGEKVAAATFVGGALVVAAVLFQIVGDLRSGRRLAPAAELATQAEPIP